MHKVEFMLNDPRIGVLAQEGDVSFEDLEVKLILKSFQN